MGLPENAGDGELLDLHLGLLEDTEAEGLAREIAESSETSARSRNLTDWLRVLGRDPEPAAPAGLVERVMTRVVTEPPLRVTPAAPPASAAAGAGRRPRVSLGELIALAACITFFVAVLVPGFSEARSRARQAGCRNNLGEVFRGVSQYAAAFNGMLPQTAGFGPNVNWLRASESGPPRVPNSRNRYLVLRLRFVGPSAFICAGRRDAVPMDAGGLDAFDDFPSPANCSFDSQNMAGPTLPLGEMGTMPIFADRNPLFENGEPPTVTSAETNSRSHDAGRGQNVLCADGTARWLTSPVFGPQSDNIWQVEGIATYTGTEHQTRPSDVFVIP